MTPRPFHAALRSARLESRRVKGLALFTVVVLVSTFLYGGSPAAAIDLTTAREDIVTDLIEGGPSLRRAAEAALLGSDADVESYVDGGRAVAEEADERAAAAVLAGMDGPAMRTAALQALTKTREDVQDFVSGGWETSWNADERVRADRVLEAGGPTTKAAAQKALAGTSRGTLRLPFDGTAGCRLRRRPSGRDPDAHRRRQQQWPGAGHRRAAGTRGFAGGASGVSRHRAVRRAGPGRGAGVHSQPDRAGETGRRADLAGDPRRVGGVDPGRQRVPRGQKGSSGGEPRVGGGRRCGGEGFGCGRAGSRCGRGGRRGGEGCDRRVQRGDASGQDRCGRGPQGHDRRLSHRTGRVAGAARRRGCAHDAGKASAARQAAQAARDAAAQARELQQVKAERDRALAQARAALDARRVRAATRTRPPRPRTRPAATPVSRRSRRSVRATPPPRPGVRRPPPRGPPTGR